jgi:hypothetical protein
VARRADQPAWTQLPRGGPAPTGGLGGRVGRGGALGASDRRHG